jgi:hypothetical protein
VDGNSTLGAVSITYTGSVWAGLMISVGLALSLVLVGRFLASPLNRMNLLTLPEFFYRRYGQHTELLVSVLTIVSFTVLIAGNLSAVAWVLSVVSGSQYLPALIVATLVIVAYTIAGGLYSAVWTDFVQLYPLVGFVAAALWLIVTRIREMVAAVPASAVDFSSVAQLEGALANWAGIIALVFGNAGARRMGASSRPGWPCARRGCYYGASMTRSSASRSPSLVWPASRREGRGDRAWCRRWPSGPCHLDGRHGLRWRAGRIDVDRERSHSRHLGGVARNVIQRWQPAF